jgi:putative addiction module killer protein
MVQLLPWRSIQSTCVRSRLIALVLYVSYNAFMGEAQPKTIEMYVTRTGSVPFEAWLLRLRDARARARIRARLARVRLGNLGDAHPVGGGVWELRIDYGPGYRVYYAQSGTATLLMLCGGDKTTRATDIRQAQMYWTEYQQRRQHEPPD